MSDGTRDETSSRDERSTLELVLRPLLEPFREVSIPDQHVQARRRSMRRIIARRTNAAAFGNALPLRHQHIHLTQLRNDLLGLVSLPRHRGPPWLESHTSGRTTSKGEDHCERDARSRVLADDSG